MNAVPLIPDTAPFTSAQRAWLNGFFAGVFSRAPAPAAPVAAAARALTPLTILFGSQTGAAEALARRAAQLAGARDFAPTVLDMASVTPARLAAEQNLLVLTSTYGEGDPPDNARALWEALGRDAVPRLDGLRFAVLALGDSHYTQFCQCGKDFDARLARHGARRLAPCAECDLDYETAFLAWLDSALGALGAATPVSAVVESVALIASPAAPETKPVYSKANPFPAPLLVSANLNGRGSAKATHHVEFSLENSGLAYKPGDALGVLPCNDPALVAEILQALGCDGEEAVPAPGGGDVSLRHALTALCDLGRPGPLLLARTSRPVQAGHGPAAPETAPFHVLDALRASPSAGISPAEFVGLLRRLQPRLYSISSSPAAHAGRVHLTVGVVRYAAQERARLGVCSTFLAERAAPGAPVPVFVQPNKNFRLPADPSVPIIMVGPGTGIAPFRGFLHERRVAGARGKNWLFFGDRSAADDFLYRDELETLRRDGLLTRLDTAWSRDQAGKIYVQHRLLGHARELYAWLEAGAHFYVCGDAARMARDVHAALHRVIETAGGKTAEQAAGYVRALQAARRCQRDIY